MNNIKSACNTFFGKAVGCLFAGAAVRTMPVAIQFVTPRVTGIAAIALGLPVTAVSGAGSLFLVPAAFRFGVFMYNEGTRDAAFAVQQAYRSRQMRCLDNPTTTIQRFGIKETIFQNAAFSTLIQEDYSLEDEESGYEQIELFEELQTANQN